METQINNKGGSGQQQQMVVPALANMPPVSYSGRRLQDPERPPYVFGDPAGINSRSGGSPLLSLSLFLFLSRENVNQDASDLPVGTP